MNYDSGIFYGSKWDETGASDMLVLFWVFFIGSLIHFYADKKNSRNKIETFVLRADEYKIVKDVEYLYMPTVKNYCEFDRGIIAFSGNMPNREVDGTFTCRMVKDGIYECFEYKALSAEDNNEDELFENKTNYYLAFRCNRCSVGRNLAFTRS